MQSIQSSKFSSINAIQHEAQLHIFAAEKIKENHWLKAM